MKQTRMNGYLLLETAAWSKVELAYADLEDSSTKLFVSLPTSNKLVFPANKSQKKCKELKSQE